MIQLVTDLPSDISCTILRDWLDFSNVIKLITAFSSTIYRTTFLYLLQLDSFYIREKVTMFGDLNVFDVLDIVGGKISSVVFRNELSPEQGSLVVEHCSNLTHVEFEENIKPELLVLLRTNSHIKSLRLAAAWVNGPTLVLPSLAGITLPSLSSLVIERYKIVSEGVDEIAGLMSNVVRLDLTMSTIAESILLQIAGLCPELKVLKLSETYGVTDNVLRKFALACPQIAHLDISYGDERNDDGILAVVQNLKGLQTLNIMATQPVTYASLVHIYTHCAATLHTLHINSGTREWYEDNPGIEMVSAAINTILQRCTKLRTLYLYDDSETSDIVLSPDAVSNLTTLVLYGKIACDENLATIGTYGTNLQVLVLDVFCDNTFTYDVLVGLVRDCSSLQELHIPRNVALTTEYPICIHTFS